MSNTKANIRLTLTPEQKEMVKNQTGKSAEAVEFSVQELEERIAPTTAVPMRTGFAVAWKRKDVGMCRAEARARGAMLPVTALVDQFYARVQAEGGGRFDSSSLIRNRRAKRQ